MRAYVRLRTPDGHTLVLAPGDIIGRLAGAALHLDDGRISEAHAMVSLRGRELRLLGLRGVFAVGGLPVDDVVLRAGMIIEPARGLLLVVEEVSLPDTLLAIEGDGLPRQLLTGTASLVTTPQPALLPRHHGEAEAHIWDTGERWRLRIGLQPVRDLVPGDTWQLGARRFRALAVSLDGAGQAPTRLDGAFRAPLRLVARFDTAHIYIEGQQVVTFDGIAARILSELAAVGGPAPWEVIAREIWKDDDRASLRRRWDVSLARLRSRLRAAHVRADLVRAGGTGQVELLLYQGDLVEDCA